MAYTKIKRSEVVSFLDTTPTTTASWAMIGVGVNAYGQDFNPQVTTEKWIINDNATSTLDSYQIQGAVSQKAYSGDDCFEYVNELRRTAGIGASAETHVLDIDVWDATTPGVYNATQYDCIIAITKYMAEEALVEYTIYYNGDPKLGTATISNGTPTFTETTASL